MPDDASTRVELPAIPNTNRLLVKLRASSALRASDSGRNLRPLYDAPRPEANAFGVAAEAQWFLADFTDGAESPWDLAHARVADQLGVAESDVVFAEPDLVHNIFPDPDRGFETGGLAAVGDDCRAKAQDGSNGKATNPTDGWHLGPSFSQLAGARDFVRFSARRTRIAHLDTGYQPDHVTLPHHVLHELERSFVEGDKNPNSAADPNRFAFPVDNSGHGTGTLSILAGREVAFLNGKPMGGAPDADIVPLRVADSVVLLRTSAFAKALIHALENGCDVLSMSMGGLPSQAWREAVDEAYLGGLCLVTAAGNNFGGKTPRNVVYPARYSRVIAACGVMANLRPYAHLQGHFDMEGNFGPDKIMRHAVAAFTPNIPWAVFGCANIVRQNGGGTSSATPQVAAAAALWLEHNKSTLPRSWHRVEAVRHALFSSATKTDFEHFGNGILQARAALDVPPNLSLPQSKSDGDSFAFLRVLTGLGVLEAPPRERMFNIELAQRWLVNRELQGIVPDPDDAQLDRETLTRFMEAVIADPGASGALRRHVAARYSLITGATVPAGIAAKSVIPEVPEACDPPPEARAPAHRRLRVYALDPSFSARLETSAVNDVVIQVRWEKLARGPVGEYLEVKDVDAANKEYAPVDLDDSRLLAQDGWAPSEGNAQFHQQMVYAVAMKTIQNFERALGRPVLWRHRGQVEEDFVPRLLVRPHALRQGNAFYSPDKVALEFGYFESRADARDQMPGSRVYACLSHDIVAHETTHAILDGMQARFSEASNPDVLAFHEAFADIVALLQHFTIPQVLEYEISRTRGNIESESLLGSLAVQFGQAIGGRGALREAIGRMVGGVWVRFDPDPNELERRITPHARGAILVAAVFDAFLAIYKTRVRDVLRIATGGTGKLPDGDIHPDLVRRLSEEAATAAGQVLNMCIRAVDYLPPVDVTFFEYLRALITADFDLVRDDSRSYRVAFVEAFRRRGIYPLDVARPEAKTIRTLSADTLRWQGLAFSRLPEDKRAALKKHYKGIISQLKRYAEACLYLRDRKQLFERTVKERRKLEDRIRTVMETAPDFAIDLGLDPEHLQTFKVHQIHAAMRTAPDGRHVPQVFVALTQTVRVPATESQPAFALHGGSTLVVDLISEEVEYRIFKDNRSTTRPARTAAFLRTNAADPLRQLLFDGRREPFGALHALAEEGV
jgi:hypothetical protein